MDGQKRSRLPVSLRRRLAVVLAAAAVAVTIGGVGYTIAANAGAATVFYGCSASDGSVKIIIAGTPPTCKPTETLQSWNAQGPQGIPGEQGVPGAQGPVGQASVVGFPHSDCPEFPESTGGGSNPQLLTISNVPGESDLDGFKDLIEAQDFSWGSSDGGGGAAGCGTGSDGSFFFDLTVTKHFDKATQPLMLANLKGTDLGTIKLEVLKSTGGAHLSVYLTFELEHAHVVSDQLSGGGGIIDEKVTFASQKAKVSYRSQKADGSLNPAIVICYDADNQVDCT